MTDTEAAALRVGQRVWREVYLSTTSRGGIVKSAARLPSWNGVRLMVLWDGNKHANACGAHLVRTRPWVAIERCLDGENFCPSGQG